MKDYQKRPWTQAERNLLRNQQEAWLKGKRVMLVIDAAGNKAEAQAVWGLPPMLRKKEANASS